MDVLKRLSKAGVVPVVVIENEKNAISTAQAMLKGGIDVMEITFRTAAAPDAIRAVAECCPNMLVGAGTVVTPEQCGLAVDCGAKFIVSPGFDREVVCRCLVSGVTVTPGCVTPTEITEALKLGLNVLKFFPAGVYGGLSALKALSGPFGGVRFIPTGGVSAQNVGEYIAAPFVHAVGGSWVCPKADIAAGSFEKITALCAEARRLVLGFEAARVGGGLSDAVASAELCGQFEKAFGFPLLDGDLSDHPDLSGSALKAIENNYNDEREYIAVCTNSICVASAELEMRGFELDSKTAKYANGRTVAVRLKTKLNGLAVRLLQK